MVSGYKQNCFFLADNIDNILSVIVFCILVLVRYSALKFCFQIAINAIFLFTTYCSSSLISGVIYYQSASFPPNVPSNQWYIFACIFQICSMPAGCEELAGGFEPIKNSNIYFQWLIIILFIYLFLWETQCFVLY